MVVPTDTSVAEATTTDPACVEKKDTEKKESKAKDPDKKASGHSRSASPKSAKDLPVIIFYVLSGAFCRFACPSGSLCNLDGWASFSMAVTMARISGSDEIAL